ncbi:MAG: glycosyltransferase [Candidatus Acidiferrales bacterium]
MVSAIIPARNEEASIARAVESVAAQPEIDEIIVVNDHSTDRTAEILTELVARIPKLKILSPGESPEGWVGKNYAVSIGAAIASGDWLLFTDADTYHYLGSTRRALTDAVDHDAVLVSYSPEQEMKSFWERALIPFVYCRLASKFSYARVNDPAQPDAAANGQFLMILRDVYRSVGGHAAVAGDVLEDVALAQRVKKAGYAIYFTAPIGIVRTRMYQTFGAMWEGWTKNLYALMGGSARPVLREMFFATFLPALIIFPSLFIVPTKLWDTPWMLGWCVVALLGWHAKYAQELYKNLFSLSYIKYLVPASCLYGAALLASWWKNSRGTVMWKGREIRVRA